MAEVIKSPELLLEVPINNASYNLRFNAPFDIETHPRLYIMKSPMRRMCSILNEYALDNNIKFNYKTEISVLSKFIKVYYLSYTE